MANRWPQVPLGALLVKTEERVEIRPDQTYRQITVRLWGAGVVLRNEISGRRSGPRRDTRHGRGSLSFLASTHATGHLALCPISSTVPS
jgi:type I restriction enzyme S subunit